MGKSHPKNRVKNRDNPTGKPIKPPADPELAAIREQKLLPLLQGLQSVDLLKRSEAAKAIAHIIEDTKCRKLLLREQIVRILFEQTLTDSSLETRTAGWGILRNLTLEEEADFCIHLYRQDVLTGIEGVARSIIETIETKDAPLSKLPKAQQDLVWNLSSSITTILTSLSEAQEEILDSVSKLSSITRFLFALILCDIAPSEVQKEALSCLTILTEDNKPLNENIVANKEWLGRLWTVKDGGDLSAIAACGVLHNIFTSLQWYDHSTPNEGLSDAALVPILAKAIGTAQPQSNGMSTNGHSKTPDSERILQLALEIVASIATSVQEGIEHESRHEKTFEGFEDKDEVNDDEDKMDADDDDLPEGAEDGEEDDEMNDEEIDADMELVLGDGPSEDDEPVDDTLDRLVRIAAPQVLILARPFQPSSEATHGLALSALNNIAWTVSSIDFSTGHLINLQKFWSTLAQQIWNDIITPVLASNTADIELASSITSLAWAVTRSVQGVIESKSDEHRKFMALYQASKSFTTAHLNGSKATPEKDEDVFQSLGVKSIGVLGRLALDPAPIQLNREIGVFLLTVVAAIPETPAAETVEALNQIFDIYADKTFAYDKAVFWTDGFYKHLEDALPRAKKMAKTIDKRTQPELRSRADEAVLNLALFLKYKKSEKSKK